MKRIPFRRSTYLVQAANCTACFVLFQTTFKVFSSSGGSCATAASNFACASAAMAFRAEHSCCDKLFKEDTGRAS